MSRSPEPGPRRRLRRRRLVALPIAALLLVGSLSVRVASADPTTSRTPVPTAGLSPVPAGDPTPADGPEPGAPIAVEPGDRFPVQQMHLPVSDRAGVAKVDSTPTETEVRLDATILFAKDSASIRPAAEARLAEVAAQLGKRGPGRLTITGYTDDLGSAGHGLILSRQRAAAVAARLRPELPGADTVAVIGRGEADPEVPNDSEAHRRLNRRVIVDFRPS